jgi:hypothetical protein
MSGISSNGSAKAYSYTFGDPVNSSDPSGTSTIGELVAGHMGQVAAEALAQEEAEIAARRAAEEAAARAVAEDQGLSRAWVQTAIGDLSEPDAAAARLGLLTALAPHQIDDTVVAAYRSHEPSDRRLLALLAWSSAQAARRIGTWSMGRL